MKLLSQQILNPYKYLIVLQSTKIGSHKNKAINSNLI